MYADTNTLFIQICKPKVNSKEYVWEKVQDAKCDFVSDWEDDFENIDEAYEEQGRNEAEHQVLNELINDNNRHLPTEIYNKLFGMLALHYELEV